MSIKIFTTIGWIVLWAVAVIAIVIVEVFWIARPAVPRGDLVTIENYLIQKLSQPGKPKLGSATLILIQNGEIVAAHPFGIANAEKKSPVEIDQTLYQMASVSKMVTAWGIMKLVEDGTLALDKPANQYLKRWKFPVSQYSDKVTIRHLLSHTGGLDDLFGYAGFLPGESIQSLEESLTLTKDSTSGKSRGVTVAREPGQNWLYSGGGYTVLQLLIEEVTQQSFSDYMEKAILKPLGMEKSSFDWEAIAASDRIDELATSFDEELQPSPHRRYTATAAASLYATPQDMARFVQAYSRTNLVLKQETLKQMMQPQPGAHQDWGLGHTLYVANGIDEYAVGHDGGNLPALGHTVRVNPATGNGIVLLISGNLELASQLGDDWVYWETGKLPMNAKLRILGNRLVPALVGIGLGALAIVIRALMK
ncbi:serine hydrolase domain-containing protein [Leptolyngbya sp. NK1-12]|uniref:serine hydrolase domain-containing protein n=1 Tax=Leptolyngbya sp. NK1-12 TaxID=2547451 RepID=UPI00292FF804|nr:serine hydrolase domain-containing protein [Leptolyngbya sp. NK1-12]